MTGFSSSFPSGAAGVGLLALRVALSCHLFIAATAIVSCTDVGWPGGLLLGISLVICGLLVLTGLFTAVVQVAVVAILLGLMTYRLVMLQEPTPSEQWQIGLFELTIAVSLVLLGPGWYSIDARLYGRREIVREPRTNR